MVVERSCDDVVFFFFFFGIVIWISLPSNVLSNLIPSGRLMFFILSLTLAVILNAIIVIFLCVQKFFLSVVYVSVL